MEEKVPCAHANALIIWLVAMINEDRLNEEEPLCALFDGFRWIMGEDDEMTMGLLQDTIF